MAVVGSATSALEGIKTGTRRGEVLSHGSIKSAALDDDSSVCVLVCAVCCVRYRKIEGGS